MSAGPMAVVAAKILASPSWNRCSSYMMTYTAFSPEGPRIALALSKDLFHWKRLGLATFGPYHGVECGDVDDKDASLFPVAIPNPSGHPELAILHRPLFPGTRPEETVRHPAARKVDLDRESIWISYCAMSLESRESNRLGRFMSHHDGLGAGHVKRHLVETGNLLQACTLVAITG